MGKRNSQIVQRVKQAKCISCFGSGWHDNTDRRGVQHRCASCDGSGLEKRHG